MWYYNNPYSSVLNGGFFEYYIQYYIRTNNSEGKRIARATLFYHVSKDTLSHEKLAIIC